MAALLFFLSALCVASLASAASAYSTYDSIIGTIDSTSGVLVNRSFLHPGIVEVMKATNVMGLRYPGAPAVACAFDPVLVIPYILYTILDGILMQHPPDYCVIA